MNILDVKNIEIRDQEHEMFAEGCHDEKPTECEVKAAIIRSGYVGRNVDIFYDNMQKLWRWTADIS